jgi:hypothetical protein
MHTYFTVPLQCRLQKVRELAVAERDVSASRPTISALLLVATFAQCCDHIPQRRKTLVNTLGFLQLLSRCIRLGNAFTVLGSWSAHMGNDGGSDSFHKLGCLHGRISVVHIHA